MDNPGRKNAPAGFGRGLNLGGDGRGGPDRWVTTGRVETRSGPCSLEEGTRREPGSIRPGNVSDNYALVELLCGRPSGKTRQRASGVSGIYRGNAQPLYRPAECGTVPAAVLFCCAVSW